MKERTFKSLQQANVERNKEWDAEGKLDAAFSGVEHLGEVGEVIERLAEQIRGALAGLDHVAVAGRAGNVVKKLVREERGVRGSRASVDELGKELADDVITAYLLAMRYNLDLDKYVEEKFNATSRKMGLSVFLDLTSNRSEANEN